MSLHQVALLPAGQRRTAGDEEEKCKREVWTYVPSILPEGSTSLTVSSLLFSTGHGPTLVTQSMWKRLLQFYKEILGLWGLHFKAWSLHF